MEQLSICPYREEKDNLARDLSKYIDCFVFIVFFLGMFLMMSQ